jgi:Flavodoxin reductases (ferredoxin-NADPH reductases) family 1
MSTPTLAALVYAIRWEANDIVSVELRPASEDVQFPAFDAGSHINLHLPSGLSRSYSLCNADTDRGRYVVGVARDRNSRGGSLYLHQQLRVGVTLPIDPPRNNFKLDTDAARSVLVAGGIGVTPLFSMLQHLVAHGRPVEFIYCARSRKEAAFVEAIEALAKDHSIALTLHFDSEKEGPPYLPGLLADKGADSHFYCCGPLPMLNAFEDTCAQLGYANTHIERFTAAPVKAEAASSGIEVVCAKSSKHVQVPAGKSILDALMDAGLSPDYSCMEGVCGTCETAVIEYDGELEHMDSVLTKSEKQAGKTMMICVSRCKGARLVLDI